MSIICPVCHNIFVQKRKTQIYCTEKCRLEFNLHKKEKIRLDKRIIYSPNCEICNVLIKSSRSFKKYCSNKCCDKSNNLKKRQIYLDQRKKHCLFCNKLITQHKRISYCTDECQYNSFLLRSKIYKTRKRRKSQGLPENHPRLIKPKGSGHIEQHGYKTIYMPGHPNSKNGGRILEHQYIMSEHLGRPLKEGENVHHKNGIRDDNRIENLELWHRGQPAGQRVEDKIAWCKEFMKQYGYEYVEIATKRLDAAQCASQKQMEMF